MLFLVKLLSPEAKTTDCLETKNPTIVRNIEMLSKQFLLIFHPENRAHQHTVNSEEKNRKIGSLHKTLACRKAGEHL